MAISQTKTTTGSGALTPILGGDLTVCAIVDSFLENFGSTWDSVTRQAAAYATSTLRDAARKDEAWSQYADDMRVKYVPNDGFIYELTGTDKELQDMRELEHGGPSGSPHPIIRTTAISNAAQISKRLKLTIPL